MDRPSTGMLPPFLVKIINDIQQIATAAWMRWGEPTEAIQDETDRGKARFVSGSMLSMSLLAGVLLPLRYLFILPDDKSLTRIAASLATAVFLIIFQRFVQRGYYKMGIIACIVLATFSIVITTVLFDVQADTFYYLLVILIFVSVVMPLRHVLALAIMHTMLMVLVASLSSPEKAFEITRWPLPNYTIIALILLIFLAQRNYLERSIRRRIQESEDRYRKVSELVSDYAYSMRRDANGEPYVEWITDSFERLTGYGQDANHYTHNISQKVTFKEDVEKLRADLVESFKGQTTVCEIRYYKPNGELGWLEVTRKPEFDPDTGEVVRVYGVGREITAHKQAREQAELIDMQRGRIHLTQEFVHAISHDFRTSLSNIETNRYLIGRKSKDAGNLTLVSHLDTIQLYVKRMSQQLDGMTAIADLGDMKFSPSSLNFLLEQIKVAYRSVAAAHHIDLRVKPCAKDVTVNMDSSKVQLAIRCLVDNALIYTQPGGQITLEITCNEHDLVIAISDNGEGIDPDHLPYIFNLFYRADPARNVHKGGVGIGLSLVRFVAEAHHGTINVTSEPGQGSIFELVLPYTPAQPQADHQTDQAPSPDMPTHRKRYQEII